MGNNQPAVGIRFHFPPAICRVWKNIYCQQLYDMALPCHPQVSETIKSCSYSLSAGIVTLTLSATFPRRHVTFFCISCFFFEKDHLVPSEVLINISAFKLWTAAAPLKCNSKCCSSQNHTMVEVERDLWRLSCPNPLLKQGSTEEAAQDRDP